MSNKRLSKIDILKIFNEKFLEFLDCILDLFPNDENIIIVRTIFSQGAFPVEDAFNILRRNILPLTDIIRKRKDSFFTTSESDELFSMISNKHVIKWRDIWTSGRLDDDDKTNIWDWVTLFLNLAEQY